MTKSAAIPKAQHAVSIGADRLLHDSTDLIAGMRVGVLTNHTGRLSDGRSIIDALAGSGICEIKALYGPEHGIGGDTPDGEVVEHVLHPRYGIQVYSLYGKTHKPTRAMLDGVDVIVCDIQDVGARFYTFISTVALAMEAAAEQNLPFIILDRPNPIRGLSFDGPVRVSSLRSFVAWMPIPVTHGLTIGELARLWNDEGWLTNGVKAPLNVVGMENWERSMWYDETGLSWIPPSPNMPSLETAVIYPGACFVEGTSISEGRGTSTPFQVLGAPWADPDRILKELSAFDTPGVACSAAEFTPAEIPGTASEPKFEGTVCRGIRLSVVDRNAVRPVHLGVSVLSAFKRAHTTETVFRNRRLDILTGNRSVRLQLERGTHPDEICEGWTEELRSFGDIRAKYLVY
ncbi:MAG: DUF1343 domain-containing protein [Ignavibacteriales bacterium]|nr:DUF1343 domain-containing protein [Ignavibacteriales bacterium]